MLADPAMLEPFTTWIHEKVSRRVWCLRAPVIVSRDHKRPLGARGQFAGVVLAARPAKRFDFVSRVVWPDRDNYESAVREAALDVLLCSGSYNATGVALSLEEIRWHDIDSCAVAFYHAARSAVSEIAGFDAFGYPRNFEPEA